MPIESSGMSPLTVIIFPSQSLLPGKFIKGSSGWELQLIKAKAVIKIIMQKDAFLKYIFFDCIVFLWIS
jgi:hypothetical protein